MHSDALKVVLPIYGAKVGPQALPVFLNTVTDGRHRLGALDIALRTNRGELEQLLREYGAREQQWAPDGWQRGRRYHENARPDNARSDRKWW